MQVPPFSRRAVPALTLLAPLAALAIALAGCSSTKSNADADALTLARDNRMPAPRRVAAIERAWSQANAGVTNRGAVRGDLKDVAWTVDLPPSVRLAALKAVFSDDTPGIDDDTRSMTRLMLPREEAPEITVFLSAESARRGWTDVTPSLVRSLSRPRTTPDADRPELRAIRALNPDRPLADVVFAVFLTPPPPAQLGFITQDRVRADAWDLLRRIDLDGTARARLLTTIDAPSSENAGVAAMQAALRDLRAVPLTGDEYLWLVSLAKRDVSAQAWWKETAGVVANLPLERTGKFQLRHLEAIRWTASARAPRLELTREALLAELRTRLDRREIHPRMRREKDTAPPPSELLRTWESQLSWGDLITVLAVDDALAAPQVGVALFAQAKLDREDRRAEYGGLLRIDGPAAQPFAAVLYPPREGQRTGDQEFVTPPDMMEQGDRALAHYHFHAQETRNGEYSGPSRKDLSYASRFGRTCVVLTSIGAGTLNADYYQPDGIVIDLGEIKSER